jgi:hypothetical protein
VALTRVEPSPVLKYPVAVMTGHFTAVKSQIKDVHADWTLTAADVVKKFFPKLFPRSIVFQDTLRPGRAHHQSSVRNAACFQNRLKALQWTRIY